MEHGLLYYKDAIPKYELTEDSMEIKIDEKIIKLHRIRALEDFGDVKKGDIGGWVESEDNLDIFCGHSWIYDDAIVCGNAIASGYCQIRENAIITDNVEIRDFAKISGNVKIFDNCMICEHAEITDNVIISGKCCISGETEINKNVRISGNVFIHGYSSIITDNVQIMDNVEIYACSSPGTKEKLKIEESVVLAENCKIFGAVNICCRAYIHGYAKIDGNAYISGDSEVYDCVKISDDCKIKGKSKIYGRAVLKDFAKVIDASVSDKAILHDNAGAFAGANICGTFSMFGNQWVDNGRCVSNNETQKATDWNIRNRENFRYDLVHNPEKIRKLIKDIEDRENAKKSREIDFINSMRFNLD